MVANSRKLLQGASSRIYRIARARIAAMEEDDRKVLYQLAWGFLDNHNVKPVCTSNHISRWRPTLGSFFSTRAHGFSKLLDQEMEEDARKLLYQLAWGFLDRHNMKLVKTRLRDGLSIEIQPNEDFLESELDKLVHQHFPKCLQGAAAMDAQNHPSSSEVKSVGIS